MSNHKIAAHRQSISGIIEAVGRVSAPRHAFKLTLHARTGLGTFFDTTTALLPLSLEYFPPRVGDVVDGILNNPPQASSSHEPSEQLPVFASINLAGPCMAPVGTLIHAKVSDTWDFLVNGYIQTALVLAQETSRPIVVSTSRVALEKGQDVVGKICEKVSARTRGDFFGQQRVCNGTHFATSKMNILAIGSL